MSRARRGQVTKDYEKVHNADKAISAKAQIRRNVIDAIGGHLCHVFDAYAGPGAMYSEAWCHTKSYVGCDKERFEDDRLMYCTDSARLMRAIDLKRFNVFDFDAFGSPYEPIIVLTARRKVAKDELLGVVFTDGCEMMMKLNSMPHALAQLAGIRAGQVGVAMNKDLILNRLIGGIARNMNCDIVKRWQVENRGPTRASASGGGILMRYVALVLKGR